MLDANSDTADQLLPDIVYKYDSNLWQCCGTDGTDENLTVACRDPTSKTFNAPPPEQLLSSRVSQTAISASSISSPTSPSTQTTNAAATVSSEPTESSKGDNGPEINGGAIAGIVIGAVIVIALVAGLAFWLGRRRRPTRKALARNSGCQGACGIVDTYTAHKPDLSQYSERPSQKSHSMHTLDLQSHSRQQRQQHEMPS